MALLWWSNIIIIIILGIVGKCLSNSAIDEHKTTEVGLDRH